MRRPRRRTAPATLLALGALAALAASPAAAAPAPAWNLDVHHFPTDFAPGSPAVLEASTEVQGSAASNEEQLIAFQATSGKFTLSFEGETTPGLPLKASAAEVRSALRALPAIGSPNVNVLEETGTGASGEYILIFRAALEKTDVPQVTIASYGPEPIHLGDAYAFDLANVGNANASGVSGEIELTLHLPSGTSFESARLLPRTEGESGWQCPGATLGDTVITCTTAGPITRHNSNRSLEIRTLVDPGASGTLTATAEASGGGAVNTATAEEPALVSGEPFGVGIPPASFTPDFLKPDGIALERAAGGHPALFKVPFDFNTTADARGLTPVGAIRRVEVDIPPGFIGDPTAVGECTIAVFAIGECGGDSQIGRIDARLDGLLSRLTVGMFNLSHPRGWVTDFGIIVGGNPVHIKAGLNPANRYAIRSVTSEINETFPPFSQQVTLWGVPAAHTHDAERCAGAGYGNWKQSSAIAPGVLDVTEECAANHPEEAFLSVPSQCSEDNTFVLHDYTFWRHESEPAPVINYTMPGQQTDCDVPRFEPSVEIIPTGDEANTPTGLDLHVKIFQQSSPTAPSTPPVKRFAVTLPQGMSFSPSFADGLDGCPEAAMHLETDLPIACPDASRIGEVELHSPLLPKAAEGSMYLAAQGDNPFGSLFALYLVIHDTEERGVLLKVPGRIDVDPVTGRITTTFDDNPQLPFDDLTLKFRSGPQAPLINPPACGKHTIGVEVASYAQPNNPVDASNTYEVTSGPSGTPCPPDSAHRPFAPKVTGGTLNPKAGSYSTFLFRMVRSDAEQELSQVTSILPKGVVAKLAGIPFCPESAIKSISTKLGAGASEQGSPACPAASQFGTLSAGLGAGPGPNYFPGKLYLAGPYKGAPLSLLVVAPGIAGPFDLGNVVVRTALQVNPETTRVTVETDPFPTILHGVILRVRDVQIEIDRPETTLNPTNCEPSSVNGVITGVGGDLNSTADDSFFNASNRFQVFECERLGFKPKLFFRLKGGTHRGDHPAFSSRLVARPGDANIGKAIVALPRSEFLENAHIGTICTRVQFAAESCPAASVYGYAKAITPLLDDPVQGEVVLRSSNNPLPDLVARLRGKINANLVGRIDSINGGIRTTFDSVPDVPVREFTLQMKGGEKGLFVNSRNLCKAPARADVRFTAQNGKRLHLRPLMQNGCKKHKKHRRHR